jgi:hypothetical protein
MDLPAGLNNRDLAVIFWSVVFFGWMLSRRDVRPSLFNVLRIFAQPLVLGTTLGLAVYTATLAALGARLGIWETGLTKETVVWFLGTGFALLMNLSRVLDRDDWFQSEAKRALRVAVVIDFFINLAVLPLPVELILVPLLTALLLMSIIAGDRDDLRQAKGCLDGVLSLLGLCLFGYVGIRVLTHWESFNNPATLESLLLPIWLTLAVMPYIYALGLWSGYQRAFKMVDGFTEDRKSRRRARLALLLGLGLRARELGQLYPYPARQVAEAESNESAREAVRNFRSGLAAERQAVREEEERLFRLAGVEGTDEEGRQLDQREFAETKEALQYIASAQMGWYNNPEHRYRDDLLSLLEPFSGLPPEHGITAHVADDGQSWWAWRRTITGWCFAIGASQKPPDQWLYDGADPPDCFPGVGKWGEPLGLGAANW